MRAYADLTAAVPIELVDELVKRLPFISEAIAGTELLPGSSRVAFDLRPGFDNDAEEIARRIVDVAAKLCVNHRPGRSKTLARQDRFPSSFHDDPHPLLEKQRELVAYGRGRYGFGPTVVGLMAAFDARIREKAAELQAPAHTFPSLIGADILDRCKYFQNFASSLNLVSHLREDHRLLQEFTKAAHWDGEQLTFDRASLSRVECLLSPAVCFHWYAWLSRTDLPAPRVITAIGKCFRYESSNLSGLERLWDFTMREIIFVGAGQYVLENRQTCIDFCVQFLDELGVAYEITSATDPFFADAYAAQAAYQQGFDLKFELLLPLPYSGRKLAVGSINYHQDFFGRSFAINANGAPAHTGCLAFGVERVALAFLAQHGVDRTRWPDAVTRRLPPDA
jgi:seryl-tRNA synthetase